MMKPFLVALAVLLLPQQARAMDSTPGLVNLLKGQKPEKPVPEWASFMSPDEHQRFVKLVQEELRRRGAVFSSNDVDGVITVKESKGGLLVGEWRLVTLAQQCKQAEPKEWPGLIAFHLDQVVKLQADREWLNANRENYSKIESKLRVRIYPPIWSDDYTASVVWREDLPGLRTALCFDLPTALTPVTKLDASKWKVPLEVAWRTGIANSIKDKSLEKLRLEIHPAMNVTAITGDEVWTSANALRVEETMGPPGRYGILVAVPHRHTVLFHKIEGGDAQGFIRAMGTMAYVINKEGPSSISPDLFWYIDGKFELAPVTLTQSGVEVKMPMPKFTERVLKPLGLAK